MERPRLMGKMAKAYKLQEALKKERQQVKIHEEEYKSLMETIVASKVKRLGAFCVKISVAIERVNTRDRNHTNIFR